MINRVLLFIILSISISYAQENREFGGTIEAEINGKLVYFPLLNSDIKANIQGDLATIEITQTFNNPSPDPLNARYLFPMNKDSAVYAMTMEVGERITRAIIKRKEEARATYEQAKAAGKAASLLTQHRPNMFTQEVANLMPGLPVKITIKYSQVVPKVDGDYELVVPLVVGPRYQPANAGKPPVQNIDGEQAENSSTSAFGTWQLEQLPDYPLVNGVTLPKTVDADRVSIAVNINTDLKIENIFSDTHSISQSGSENSKAVMLKDGQTIDNKDFVLRYALAGEAVQAGFLSTVTDEGEGYFSLMIEPPAMPQDAQITRREMVFVLDTSGSMRGQPLDASKLFMRHALDNLRKGDYFRIISFNNTASEYSRSPQAATKSNIRSGLRFVDNLNGGGGTEIGTSITQAFKVPPAAGTVRIVVFLTDGYIGNEQQIFAQLENNIADARVYAFGVGTSVNRYLLSEMGRRGRGFVRFIDPTEDADDVAISLANKLNAPVLTNISVDFGDMDVSELTPAIIPDLFAGDSLRIQGKYKGEGDKTIRVKGVIGTSAATLPVQVSLATEPNKKRESIPIIWARSMVADKMRQFSSPFVLERQSLNTDQIKADIVALGLNHSLVTQWTSFVAVDDKIINKNPENTKTSDVVLPKVDGVENSAYGVEHAAAALETVHQGGNFVMAAPAPAPAMPAPQYQADSDVLTVVGTRVKGRTALDSNVPVDAIQAAELRRTPSLNMKDATTPTPTGGTLNSPIAHMPVASTPEPGVLGGLLLMTIMGFFAFRRGKRG